MFTARSFFLNEGQERIDSLKKIDLMLLYINVRDNDNPRVVLCQKTAQIEVIAPRG